MDDRVPVAGRQSPDNTGEDARKSLADILHRPVASELRTAPPAPSKQQLQFFQTSYLPFEIDESALVEVPSDDNDSSQEDSASVESTTEEPGDRGSTFSTRFPRGCPVLFCDPNTFSVSLGVVLKVYVHPLDVMKNLCCIILFQPSAPSIGHRNNHRLFVVDTMLQFGPECPVWIHPHKEAGIILESYHSFCDHSKPAKYSVTNEKQSAVRHGVSIDSLTFRPTSETERTLKRLQLLSLQKQGQHRIDSSSIKIPIYPPPPPEVNGTSAAVAEGSRRNNPNDSICQAVDPTIRHNQNGLIEQSLNEKKRSRESSDKENSTNQHPVLPSDEEQSLAPPLSKKAKKAAKAKQKEVTHSYFIPAWVPDSCLTTIMEGLIQKKDQWQSRCKLSWEFVVSEEKENELQLRVDLVAPSKRSFKTLVFVVEFFLLDYMKDPALKGRLHWELTSERELKGSSASRKTPLTSKSILNIKKLIHMMVIRIIGSNNHDKAVEIPSLAPGAPGAIILLEEIGDILKEVTKADGFLLFSRGIGDGHHQESATIYLEGPKLSVVKSAQKRLEDCVASLGLVCLHLLSSEVPS